MIVLEAKLVNVMNDNREIGENLRTKDVNVQKTVDTSEVCEFREAIRATNAEEY